MRRAAQQGAQIVCLPELFSTMYFCVETRREYFDWAEEIPGPTIDRMAVVAKEAGIVLIAPIFGRADGGRHFNTAAVLGPDGQLIGKYRKSSIPFMDVGRSAEQRGNDPRGEILRQASDSNDDIVIADVELSVISELRALWGYYRDRRPDQYGPLVRPVTDIPASTDG